MQLTNPSEVDAEHRLCGSPRRRSTYGANTGNRSSFMQAGSFREARRRGARLAGVGVGLRREHLDDWLSLEQVPTAFCEFTPENFLGRGGYQSAALTELAGRIDLLGHGLTLSLGGASELDVDYLYRLRELLEAVRAPWHSDHICFASAGKQQLHELVPLPWTADNASRVARRLQHAEQSLGLPVCAENVTWYCQWGRPELSESEFLTRVLLESGCGLVLDLNNVYVNSQNHGFCALDFVRSLPLDRVVEIHVAGHECLPDGLLLDTHGAATCAEVRGLLEETLKVTGPLPVLLERDHDIPDLDELLDEAEELQELFLSASQRACSRAATTWH